MRSGNPVLARMAQLVVSLMVKTIFAYLHNLEEKPIQSIKLNYVINILPMDTVHTDLDANLFTS